jgi:hypothetical protein
MPTLEERLATLEAHRENEMRDASELKRKLEEVDNKVDQINSKMDGQRGFVAGALAVLTFIWGVVGAVAVAMWNHFTSGGDLPQ